MTTTPMQLQSGFRHPGVVRRRPSLAAAVTVAVIACIFTLSVCAASPDTKPAVETCDVVIVGGSAASLAAAITAAQSAPSKSVCFLEATDWPGGQLSASGVSAIDYGKLNRQEVNQPRSFREMLGRMRNVSNSCWVSTLCFQPSDLMENAILPMISETVAETGLRVFLRTVIVSTQRDAVTGNVLSVKAVTRSPVNADKEWDVLLSDDVEDWYSPESSRRFEKKTTIFRGTVFLEASEFGDLLVTGDMPFAQGVESPQELSEYSQCENCGQAATVVYFTKYSAIPATGHHSVPQGGGEGESFEFRGLTNSVPKLWSYRRAFYSGNSSLYAVNEGDVSQMNWGGGNDLETATIWLAREDAVASARRGEWSGGVNTTALQMAEDRAYGSFHWLLQQSQLAGYDVTKMNLARDESVTGTGLSRMPYIRDTRRAVGLDGFRLAYPQISGLPDYSGREGYGYRFPDTVALGDYSADTHSLLSCELPAYMEQGKGRGPVPYYIPLRALTVDGAPNVLAAGKTMAQTFHANSATRVHPSEWSSGVAAGCAAAMMVDMGITTTTDLVQEDNVSRLQSRLADLGQPLEWSDQNA